MEQTNNINIVKLSSVKFLACCLALSLIILVIGQFYPFSSGVVAAEVLLMILLTFVFGSIRYRIDKNAITYGMAIVVSATFWKIWWQTSFLCHSVGVNGAGVFLELFQKSFFNSPWP